MASVFTVDCRVCGLSARSTHADGWLLCIIERRGGFFSTPELDLSKLRLGMSAGAYVCGQLHALTLFERYLERHTFEPLSITDATYLAQLLREEATV